jgi:hypothetical protein
LIYETAAPCYCIISFFVIDTGILYVSTIAKTDTATQVISATDPVYAVMFCLCVPVHICSGMDNY